MQGGKVCMMCGKPKADSAYYQSSSPFHADGLFPVCKKCLIQFLYDPLSGSLDIDKFKLFLRQTNKPYLPDVLQMAKKQFNKQKSYLNKTGLERIGAIIGLYLKNLSMSQFKNLRWDNEESKINECNMDMMKRQIVYCSDDDNLFDKSTFTEDQIAFLNAMYKCFFKYYNIADGREKSLFIEYIQDRFCVELAYAQSDIDYIDEYVNNAYQSLVALKRVQGGKKNLEFAEYLDIDLDSE